MYNTQLILGTGFNKDKEGVKTFDWFVLGIQRYLTYCYINNESSGLARKGNYLF